jgi:hypothetical protein
MSARQAKLSGQVRGPGNTRRGRLCRDRTLTPGTPPEIGAVSNRSISYLDDESLREAVPSVETMSAVRALEAQGARDYWSAWQNVAITFPKKDWPRVPDRGDGTEGCRLGGADRLAPGGWQTKIWRRKETGAEGCPRKPLKMARSPASAYQEEAGMTLRGPPESLGMESTKDTAPNGGAWAYICRGRSQNGNPGLYRPGWQERESWTKAASCDDERRRTECRPLRKQYSCPSGEG